MDTLKEVYELSKNVITVEAREKLLEAREEALKLQEENLSFKARIKELENKLSVKENLEWDGKSFWKINQDGKKDGPYCQRCYETEERLVHLQDLGMGQLHCVRCGVVY
jgi:hypothetical protein